MKYFIHLLLLACFCAPTFAASSAPTKKPTASAVKPVATVQKTSPVATPKPVPPPLPQKNTVNLNLRDAEIAEVMDMLSRKERINILLSNEVKGKVSVNLYDVGIPQAIRIIANAAGFASEHRDGMYFIVKRDEVGKYGASGNTVLKTFRIQYSKPEVITENLKNYLSAYGKINTLPERNIIVVEDMPVFVKKIDQLIEQLDKEPKQILIEARILEIKLDDTEVYGLDWSNVFTSKRFSKGATGKGNIGIRGLDNPTADGFFLNFVNANINTALNLLETQNRVKTLSSPKLMVLENQEAKVIIGGREGYKVTTTINLVTTETIQFLDFGVILKVTPFVDNQRRIWLQVHPEVSSVEVKDGVPGKKSTEVETRLLLEDGQTAFIGGLIKNTVTENRKGIPVLKDIPGVRLIFSNKNMISNNTETIVLLTPRIVDQNTVALHEQTIQHVDKEEKILTQQANRLETEMTQAKKKDLH